MILDPIRTYYTVATCEFTDIYGNDWKCFIERDSKFGEPATVKVFEAATGDPLRITLRNQGDPIETTIKTSEAKLSIFNFENFDTLNLLLAGNRSYRMIVTKNTGVYWMGFLAVEGYNEPFVDVPYPTTLTFIDGLSLLKFEPFTDSNDCYFRGFSKDYQIIGFLLSKIGLDRDFYDGINIIDATPSGLFGTFDEKIKDLEAFRGMNCYEVMDMILRSYVAKVEYHNNAYHFTRANDTDDIRITTWYRRIGGQYEVWSVDNVETTAMVNNSSVAEATRIVFLEQSGQLSRISSIKKFTLNQIYGLKETMIPRGLLDSCDFQENGETKGFSVPMPGIVTRAEIDDTVCALMSGTMASVQTQVPYKYGAESGLFEFELTLRNNTFVPFESQVEIVGAKPSFFEQAKKDYLTYGIYGVVGLVRFIRDLQKKKKAKPADNLQRVPDYETCKIDEPGPIGLWFVIPRTPETEYLWDIAYTDTSPTGPPNGRVVFTDPKTRASGVTPGYIYRALVGRVTTGDGAIIFRVWDDIIDSALVPSSAQEGDEFSVSLRFSYMPVQFWFTTGNAKPYGALQTGVFLENNIHNIDMQIPENSLNDKSFFSIRQTMRLPYTLPQDGNMNIKISNIRRSNDLFALSASSIYLESIKVRLLDTPEIVTETHNFDTDATIEKDLDVFFAETPIVSKFINNVYKYFNNFYSVLTTFAPSLQKISTFTTEKTLKQHIIDTYRGIYLSPRIKLTGTLDSPNISLFGKTLIEPYTSKKYVMTGCDFDVKRARYNGEWQEIGIAIIEDPVIPVIPGSFSDDFSDDFDT